MKLDREVGNGWIVRDGLNEGDRIIVDGVMRVRPGAPVKASPYEAEARHSRGKGRAATGSRPGRSNDLEILHRPAGLRLRHFDHHRHRRPAWRCASLPIEQYPAIVPPEVTVNATYPGASAESIASTVAAPLEQQINGVEKMLYMRSTSTGLGHAVHHHHLCDRHQPGSGDHQRQQPRAARVAAAAAGGAAAGRAGAEAQRPRSSK